MTEIDKKIDKIEKNCLDIAKREMNSMKNETDKICNEQVGLKVDRYKDELAKKYTNEINKIERELNRNIFDYEMEERVKIKNYKQSLINDIESNVTNNLLNFVDSDQYKDYLLKKIQSTIRKIGKSDSIKLYVIEKDYDRFYDEINSAFNISLEKISNDNIGGCMLEDKINRISIDNTIKTNIKEKVSKINI